MTSSYFDTNENIYKTKKYTGSEECVVDNIKLCGTFNADTKKIVCITLRVPVRNGNLLLESRLFLMTSTSFCREIRPLEINLLHVPDKKASFRKNGLLKIYRLLKVVLFQISSSIPTVFHLG